MLTRAITCGEKTGRGGDWASVRAKLWEGDEVMCGKQVA